ncbi:hypothetical protein QE152_g29675 [Popillia japonica]|uniref:PiggyBac transposable element-derived protein domain-containing protein n=1 Tax=Popillia japonica TaxID=7064 RepID=A0AAW1JGP1_POPJA
MDDNRRPLKPEELKAIINEMSDIEYHSDDSEYILSDDDGEIDVIEGLTDNKGNSEADEDNSGPDNEDNSEIDRSSGDSDANNEDEDSDDQANTNGQTFVSKNKQVWHAAPVKLSQGRLGQQNILREKSGPTRYANRGDSDANNEDEDSDDQANTNGQTFVSKNKQVWHAAPVKLSQGRLGQQNILREKSGPTRYANREVDSIYSAFLIFFRQPLMKIIVKWINVEGNTVFGNRWKEIDENELQKFIGVLILIGAYKSRNEEISLWILCSPTSFFGLLTQGFENQVGLDSGVMIKLFPLQVRSDNRSD